MTGEEFKGLSIDERVIYLNKRMATGESLSAIFRSLGISKSQSATIKKQGYILQDNKYIKQETSQETPKSLTEPPKDNKKVNTLPKATESIINENKPIQEKFIDKLLQEQKETVKKLSVGRPGKEGRRKATLYLEDTTFKELQQWALWNNCSASDVINALVKDFLKSNIGK